MEDKGYTNGEPFLITSVSSDGERSRHINYLLPDGSRRRVTIDLSEDSQEIRDAIGDALVNRRRKYGH